VTEQERREESIAQACDELRDLLIRKNRAYGPSAIKDAPGGPLNGLRVRIFDKHARLQNLAHDRSLGNGVPDEALEDTLLDLAGYGVIGVLAERDLW